MKLLLDENLSPQLASELRLRGHDAVSALEASLIGLPDEAVRESAKALERVLVTLDADFANIVRFPPQGTPGVIRLRVKPELPDLVRRQLVQTLAHLADRDLRDCLAVGQGGHSPNLAFACYQANLLN